MAKSPEEMRDSMIANMPKNTGKSLDEWLVICQSSDAEKHGQLVKWLKSEQGLTHGFANLIAHAKINGLHHDAADLIALQYAGAKADLKPIYDALIKSINRFNGDTRFRQKKPM